MARKHTPLVLLILDGFGHRVASDHNAIALAHAPHWRDYWSHAPHCLLDGSGLAVGLPPDQMGNSEVGHLNIGAGRIVQQDFTRIDAAIADGSFTQNAIFLQAMQDSVRDGSTLHLLGLLSPGGVHSHENHLFALIEMAAQQGVKNLVVHAFLDGRDTPPKSALPSIERLEKVLATVGCGTIGSICGRYYAMDRDERWDRMELAYDMFVAGTPFTAMSAKAALNQAYERGESDEFVKPTHINQAPFIADGDSVIFMNFRADRARQLSRLFLSTNFTHFTRKRIPKLKHFISLTQYADDIHSEIAFPPLNLKNVLGEYLATQGLRQLRIAETEKYAHVTFFFNGGEEQAFASEDRVLIPSPRVATYDLQPEMSAHALTECLLKTLQTKRYDVVIANFANADMVGHTGDLAAAIKAVEALDACLNQIVQGVRAQGGEIIITADHGNAECMFDEKTQQAHTAHTCEPVPFVYIGRALKTVKDRGSLRDIAPTMLYLLDLPIPKEMTGDVLLGA